MTYVPADPLSVLISGTLLGLILWGFARAWMSFHEKWKGRLLEGILDFFGL